MIELSKTSIAFLLPFLVFGFFSFETADQSPVYENEVPTIQLDSFPPLPVELIGQEVDTIITFDPATKTEKVTYRAYEPPAPKASEIKKEQKSEIDTLIIFDPVTKKETIKIINNSSGN